MSTKMSVIPIKVKIFIAYGSLSLGWSSLLSYGKKLIQLVTCPITYNLIGKLKKELLKSLA